MENFAVVKAKDVGPEKAVNAWRVKTSIELTEFEVAYQTNAVKGSFRATLEPGWRVYAKLTGNELIEKVTFKDENLMLIPLELIVLIDTDTPNGDDA